jgi:hypothetical protein
MKALFLGHFAATVAPRILAKVTTPLETSILDDEGDAEHLAPLLANAEIVVGHIWRAGFPPAPRLRLLQSVALLLHGTAGAQQVRVRAETALAAFTTPSSGRCIMFGKHPS